MVSASDWDWALFTIVCLLAADILASLQVVYWPLNYRNNAMMSLMQV